MTVLPAPLSASRPVSRTVPPAAYHVGLFALIHRQGTYLMVRPRQPLLPDSPWSPPGLLLGAGTGQGLAEQQLRRTLLSQLSLAVGDFRLAGSHAGRPDRQGQGAQLHLIFATEYASGLVNPQASELRGAEWLTPDELRARGVPAWVLDATALQTDIHKDARGARRPFWRRPCLT
ncbi:hypothetical protein [Deinococcus navajonensis]|uniref:ADP-ribose pyrophosphatase YjhB (NUDIX family) n=1 Tax=Deinococcus navajonensis TaxID=309884 RepID=A0ABV8XPK5_9DEIO